MAFPSLCTPKGHVLKQKFGGREKIKAFTLRKDGDFGKSEAKPKDTMIKVGDNLRTWRVVSSAFWNRLSLSGSLLNVRTSVSAGDTAWCMSAFSVWQLSQHSLTPFTFTPHPILLLPIWRLDGQSIGGGGWSSPYVVHLIPEHWFFRSVLCPGKMDTCSSQWE